jgi:hypothetical protein
MPMPVVPAVAVAGAAGVVVVVAQLGVFGALGAHPFWAAKIGWIGAGLGAAAALGLRAHRGRGLAIALALTACGAAAAVLGKRVFAASYAENALAGQAWYFGWITTATGLTAALALAALAIVSGLRRQGMSR